MEIIIKEFFLTKLIGLYGQMGSGKDTAADFIQMDYNVKRMAFADPLKEMMCSLLSINRATLEDRAFKEKPHPLLGGKTPRFAMQTIGTDWGREMISGSLWIDIARSRIEAALNENKYDMIVLTDIRFNNEAILINKLGGLIVDISRKDNPHAHSSHISESGISNEFVDVTVENNGSLEEFKNNIINAILL